MRSYNFSEQSVSSFPFWVVHYNCITATASDLCLGWGSQNDLVGVKRGVVKRGVDPKLDTARAGPIIVNSVEDANAAFLSGSRFLKTRFSRRRPSKLNLSCGFRISPPLTPMV